MGKIFPFVFLGICVISVFIIGYFLKKENKHLFTQKYKQLIDLYGNPLKKFSFLSGYLGPAVIPYLQFRGVIAVDVYVDKLIVSVWGDALCVPYEQGRIYTERKWIFNYLVIKDVAVPADIAKFSARRGELPQQAPLAIWLSKKKIDFIMSFVQKVQQN